jgi:glycosyltransferase involved in cell wall biosynthesis
MMDSGRIAVVIPCYNTSSTSVDVIRKALTIADAVLAVNDGSTDDTASHLERSGARCLHLRENGGKGVALRAGIEAALEGPGGLLGDTFDYIVTLDGDGQHDPADIPRLYDCARRSAADLVIGGRNVALMPPKSKFGNRFSREMFHLATGVFVPDTQSGYRLMTSELARALLDDVRWKRYETEFEILFRTVALGFKLDTVEIPTIYFDENRGSHFNPFRDSMRVFAVTCRHLLVRFKKAQRPRIPC